MDCNRSCTYCYERETKDLIKSNVPIDLDAVERTVRMLKEQMPTNQITLHGGECLLLGHDNVERLLKLMVEYEGQSSVVTNGTLIDDDYVDLFKKYNTSLSISCDGPGKMNGLRANVDDTRELMDTIESLTDDGIIVRMMTMLHKFNEDRPSELLNWIAGLADIGVNSGRVNAIMGPYAPQSRSYYEVTRGLLPLCVLNPKMVWNPVSGILQAMINGFTTECSYLPCDPYNTTGAHTVLGDGTLTCCMLSQAMGLHASRDDQLVYGREYKLMTTPKKDGGCQGCKYWTLCYGGCSSSNFDWRVKDAMCDGKFLLYRYIEEYLYQMEIEPKFPENVVPPLEVNRRVITRKFEVPVNRDTTVNGIRIKESPDKIEVWYNAKIV